MRNLHRTILGLSAFGLVLWATAPAGQAAAPAYDTKIPQIRVALSQTAVQAGDTFEAAFWLQGYLGEYGGIEGFELQADYDPELLRPDLSGGSEVFRSRIFPASAKPITWMQSAEPAGTLRFAQSLPPQSGSGQFYGSGKLGVVTFRALKDGAASITLRNTVVIKPGNPGVNIRHATNRPSVTIGVSAKPEEDRLTAVGSMPKNAAAKRTEQEIIGSFTDRLELAEVPWAREAIAALTQYGAVKGMPDGSFRPSQPMTRAEFAHLAAMALAMDMEQRPAPTFGDILPGDWYYDAVETASAQGLINGYASGNGSRVFRPENVITRAEIAAIYSRVLDRVKQPAAVPSRKEPDFRDVAPDHWARASIGRLYQWGIVNGKDANSFDPEATATRAEVSVMLHKLLLVR
ncbi:S-layer homology domain-containing protein [Gorillibacterium sp. sgz5001074]|uniref:S-layer homology domain-containing protein n=1 Tax=Gorillibacterium sp. sgz5001074 TaxID=3446695 RepID=UPI003F6809A9